jgi:hypothetical protein
MDFRRGKMMKHGYGGFLRTTGGFWKHVRTLWKNGLNNGWIWRILAARHGSEGGVGKAAARVGPAWLENFSTTHVPPRQMSNPLGLTVASCRENFTYIFHSYTVPRNGKMDHHTNEKTT